MKKTHTAHEPLTLAVIFAVVSIVFTFAGCDNFMADIGFKEKLQEEVKIATADSVDVTLQPASSVMGTTYLNGTEFSGDTTQKVGIPFTVKMKFNTGYVLREWIAVKKSDVPGTIAMSDIIFDQYVKGSQEYKKYMLSSDYVTFSTGEYASAEEISVVEGAATLESTVTLKTTEPVYIIPVCVKQVAVASSYPADNATNVDIDASYFIGLSAPIMLSNLYKIGTYNNLGEYYSCVNVNFEIKQYSGQPGYEVETDCSKKFQIKNGWVYENTCLVDTNTAANIILYENGQGTVTTEERAMATHDGSATKYGSSFFVDNKVYASKIVFLKSANLNANSKVVFTIPRENITDVCGYHSGGDLTVTCHTGSTADGKGPVLLYAYAGNTSFSKMPIYQASQNFSTIKSNAVEVTSDTFNLYLYAYDITSSSTADYGDGSVTTINAQICKDYDDSGNKSTGVAEWNSVTYKTNTDESSFTKTNGYYSTEYTTVSESIYKTGYAFSAGSDSDGDGYYMIRFDIYDLNGNSSACFCYVHKTVQ